MKSFSGCEVSRPYSSACQWLRGAVLQFDEMSLAVIAEWNAVPSMQAIFFGLRFASRMGHLLKVGSGFAD